MNNYLESQKERLEKEIRLICSSNTGQQLITIKLENYFESFCHELKYEVGNRLLEQQYSIGAIQSFESAFDQNCARIRKPIVKVMDKKYMLQTLEKLETDLILYIDLQVKPRTTNKLYEFEHIMGQHTASYEYAEQTARVRNSQITKSKEISNNLTFLKQQFKTIDFRAIDQVVTPKTVLSSSEAKRDVRRMIGEIRKKMILEIDQINQKALMNVYSEYGIQIITMCGRLLCCDKDEEIKNTPDRSLQTVTLEYSDGTKICISKESIQNQLGTDIIRALEELG